MTKNKPCTLCNVKTNWLYFQELLKTTLDNSIPLKTDDDITNAVKCVWLKPSSTTNRLECNADPVAILKSISNTHRLTIKEKNNREKEAPQAVAD